MIRIGLSQKEKQREIDSYLQSHDIKKVYCFYFKKFPVKYNVSCVLVYRVLGYHQLINSSTGSWRR